MNDFYYDLHLHSCLSPCADNDNTPNNIAGRASLSELDVIALTDHNSTKNCPAFFDAAKNYGITPIAGMELTTSEDIHVICLFEHLDDAMRFGEEIEKRRMLIKNRPDIFGEQLILDSEDNVIGTDEYLLSNATTLSIEDVPDLVESFDGICYPAHIDRMSNGIIAILGTLPPTPFFKCLEFHSRDKIEGYRKEYGIKDKTLIISSDAHFLTDIRDKENCFTLNADKGDHEAVRRELFSLFGKRK